MTELSTSIWTQIPELKPRLVRLYRLREMLSYSRIASELSREFKVHINSNMVVGKIHRMGLQPREVVRVAPTLCAEPPAGDHGLKPARPAVPQGSVHFLELPNWGCKFPYGEPPETRFCGRVRWGERPYCPQHCRVAYHPPRARA